MSIFLPIPIGTMFGCWTVIGEPTQIAKQQPHNYLCECKCGYIKNIRGSRLKTMKALSCPKCRILPIGTIFNDWTVISEPIIYPEKYYPFYYKCQCKCGNIKELAGRDLWLEKTKSCQLGKCHRRFRNGLTHLQLGKMWNQMMARCYNPKAHNYRWYGARGITVCARWHDCNNYIADLVEKPPKLELDRIDNDKEYSPENTRWATHKENVHNSRSMKHRKTL